MWTLVDHFHDVQIDAIDCSKESNKRITKIDKFLENIDPHHEAAAAKHRNAYLAVKFYEQNWLENVAKIHH